jgi:hypothetical protein
VKRRFTSMATVIIAVTGGFLLGTAPASAQNASNGYPYCKNGSASDPDGDGWGWEHQASCVVRNSRADPKAGGSGSAGGAAKGGSSHSAGACPPGASCGSYAIAGLGRRKQQIRSAGGSVLDLAVAMLESDTMQASYAYGDYKSGDAANFGIFKQNWQMIRTACSPFSGHSASQWNDGAVLNKNLSADVACLHQSQRHYSLNTWFAGHRNGASGLSNPNTPDINAYKKAVYWIRDQLSSNPANLGNDIRFWVNVPAI